MRVCRRELDATSLSVYGHCQGSRRHGFSSDQHVFKQDVPSSLPAIYGATNDNFFALNNLLDVSNNGIADLFGLCHLF